MDYIEKARFEGHEVECTIKLRRCFHNKEDLKNLVDLLEWSDDALEFYIYKDNDSIPIEIIRPQYEDGLLIKYNDSIVKEDLSEKDAVEFFNKIIGQKVCSDLVLED